MFYYPDPAGYRELLPGVFMKVLTHGPTSMICEFNLKQGAVIPMHSHPQEQTGYLVRGKLRLIDEAGENVVTPGCSWNFPGDVRHGAHAEEECLLVEVFSPLRADYLTASAE